jgi:hypothetical protein
MYGENGVRYCKVRALVVFCTWVMSMGDVFLVIAFADVRFLNGVSQSPEKSIREF